MAEDLVAVFTGKSLKNGMTADGGSGHWRARENRVKEASYLLCIRNRRETWAETDFEHGTAFLVARISGTSNSQYDKRIVINFNEYAEIDVADAWHICTVGQHYPVAYLNADEVQKKLGLNFKTLAWKPFNPNAQPSPQTQKESPMNIQRTAIQEAKAMLSDALGVPEENIEITVRY
jgi:hypothetical protein